MGPLQSSSFWEEECPNREPGLNHAHWDKCDPKGVHPGTDKRHDWTQCCHCGFTFESWEQRHLVAEPTKIADLDDAPLELPQNPRFGTCSYGHSSTKALIGDDGMEWEKCPGCGVQKEPRFESTGPGGPYWGPGRGWVSPRMKRRWESIAFRLRGQLG